MSRTIAPAYSLERFQFTVQKREKEIRMEPGGFSELGSQNLESGETKAARVPERRGLHGERLSEMSREPSEHSPEYWSAHACKATT